jgi:flavorubredoxin
MRSYAATDDIDVINTDFPIPGYGMIPINAFVLHGREPLLVDTGPVIQADDFARTLETVIDPMELRWIWLTHTDFDHIGSLHDLLDANPDLRVITSFLGVGIMSTSAPLPMDRVHLLNPGQSITVGDRTLTALRPPVFDNPSTTGFHDERSGLLVSSDCFGALLPEVPEDAADLTEAMLRDGQVLWATIDSPWVHKVDRARFARELDEIRSIEPTMVLSSHLPPASGRLAERMLAALATVPDAQPFIGPDQAALEQMLSEMTEAPAEPTLDIPELVPDE